MMDDPWWCFGFSQERASSENQFVLTILVLVHIMERSCSTQTELLSESSAAQV